MPRVHPIQARRDEAKISQHLDGLGDKEQQEVRNLARDAYLSWMAEVQIGEMLESYQRKQFGWKAFLFYFGASLLGACVAQVISRCFL